MRTCHVRPLAAALASLLGAQAFAESTDNTDAMSVHSSTAAHVASARHTTAAANNTSPTDPHNVLTMKNCQDDGVDSLRASISAAGEGDTILFDINQMNCSVITLSSAEIPIIRNDLTLQGPTDGTTITLSGGGHYRIFNHVGSGTLSLENLKVEDGYAQGNGGCLRSNGNVSLRFTEIVGCAAVNGVPNSYGGRVAAERNISLVKSTLSGNRTGTATSSGHGGGIHSNNGDVVVKYSSITDNYASVRGGGMVVGSGSAYVVASTVDHNSSKLASAFWLSGASQIVNSTISSNIAYGDGTAIFSRFGSLSIENSTVTQNHDDAVQPSGAVFFMGPSPADQLTFQSSIIANNTSGPADVPADIFSAPGQGAVFGGANLVGSSNVWPPGVFVATADARLGPLQANGGFTRTHALLSDSPARGIGNDNAGLSMDQRGTGYPRTTGIGPSMTADIGSVQFDSIFFGGFEVAN
jgi:hypothetical protein